MRLVITNMGNHQSLPNQGQQQFPFTHSETSNKFMYQQVVLDSTKAAASIPFHRITYQPAKQKPIMFNQMMVERLNSKKSLILERLVKIWKLIMFKLINCNPEEEVRIHEGLLSRS